MESRHSEGVQPIAKLLETCSILYDNVLSLFAKTTVPSKMEFNSILDEALQKSK